MSAHAVITRQNYLCAHGGYRSFVWPPSLPMALLRCRRVHVFSAQADEYGTQRD